MKTFYSEIDLLSSNFDASLAIKNLNLVKFPENTNALDNLGKAKLLLPFGVQERIDQENSNTSEIKIRDSEKKGICDSFTIEVSSMKNKDYKFSKKKKFIENKSVFFSVTKKFKGLRGGKIPFQKVEAISKSKHEKVSRIVLKNVETT
ncbi:hypothetical protein FG386_000014 [Cryptosporidium ryanae]|uniref:uncharacterized protein n=1 Tax=Cryptosporidium ryanae TaxID=515981 RepID=UPI003519FDE7|nr:hypothetical protein FG386_000014 [Cryptosporidium ryanae]